MERKTVVCVAALVLKENMVLSVRQSQGHSLEGKWTVPWGRLEDGESPREAALRETAEEGGVVASVDGLLGVQELPDPWAGWIALAYLCRFVDGVPAPDGWETDAARFLTLDELKALDEPIEPWSKWIMQRVLRNDFTLIAESAGSPFCPSAGFI